MPSIPTMPHDLTDEQFDELAALVMLFDVELSEELDDLAGRLSTARGNEPRRHSVRGRREARRG
jgi:hypothetical protein